MNEIPEELAEFLPNDIIESKDIDLLKTLRDWADDQVQTLKAEKEQRLVNKYKPDIEGKFLLKYGYCWDGPIKVKNINDIEIIYVKKIDFVGRGFIRCNAVVINIIGYVPGSKLDNAGLSATDYDEVRISAWQDDQYDIDFELAKNPVVLTREEVDKKINFALNIASKQTEKFWEAIENG